MEKLEVKQFGIQQADGSRIMTGDQAQIENITEKINEIVDWINNIKE